MQREQEEPGCDGAAARERTAHLERVHQPALDLRGRRRQDEEVEREEDEDRHEIDQPLEDDRREARRGRDRVTSGDEPRPEDLARARHEQARGEPDHGRREEVRHPDPPERRQESPPAPGPDRVEENGDQHETRERQPAGARQGAAERRPVHPPEEEGEQPEGGEGPQEEPPALGVHDFSAPLTSSWRSNT